MSKINLRESAGEGETVHRSITFMFLVMGHSREKYKIDRNIYPMTLENIKVRSVRKYF